MRSLPGVLPIYLPMSVWEAFPISLGMTFPAGRDIYPLSPCEKDQYSQTYTRLPLIKIMRSHIYHALYTGGDTTPLREALASTFEYLCYVSTAIIIPMLWVYSHYKFVILPVRERLGGI